MHYQNQFKPIHHEGYNFVFFMFFVVNAFAFVLKRIFSHSLQLENERLEGSPKAMPNQRR